MNNFQYYNPVRVMFGEGHVKQLAEHGMTELGEHKANDLQVSRRILQRAAGKA